MKRKTKRFPALLLAAVMAFGLCTSAFAETATPETAAVSNTQSDPAVVEQTAEEECAPAVLNEVENPAADFMVTSWDNQGNTTMGERIHCATVQEAINLAVEAGKTADPMHSMPNVYLMRDVTESITVPQSEWQLWLDLNTHNLTAANGPAITLEKNAQLGIRSWQGQTVVAGGSNSAIVCGDNSTLMISGGIFTSDTDIIQEGNICNILLYGGNFNKKLPDSMIPQGYEQVERGGMYTVRQATSAIARVEGKPQWTEYTSVQEAINAAIAEANTDGYRSVRLMTNVTESITIEGLTANLSIDLDGWTLTAKDGKPAITAGAISGEGRVFIEDSSGTGTVNGGGSSAIIVKETNDDNSANLNINGGKFVSDAAPVLVVNGKAYITGGNFVGAAGQPIVQYGTTQARSENNSPNGCVKIGGGTWLAATDGSLLAVQPGIGNTGYAWCDVIEGQSRYGKTQPTCYGKLGDAETVNNGVGIMAGSFDCKVPVRCLARGYVQTQEDGMYVVRYAGPVATAGGMSYDSVQDAVYTKGQNGETVKLLRDTSENVFINMDTNVTIDLDGHTITQMSDGQLGAVINNNGTLTIRGGGTLVGTLAMYHDNAVTYLESRDQLQGGLADGVAFMKDKVNGMYAVMTYSVETATQLTNAIDTADTAVKSFYGSTQQLSALTAAQVKNANKMTAKEKQLVEDAYTALMNLDQTAVQRVLATENYAALEASRQIVLDLYTACSNTEIDTEKKDVFSEVDASKAEKPETDATVPADKQPTAEDAKKAVEKIIAEVTANETVNDFKGNGLTQIADLTKIPEAASAGRLTFSVQVSLQKVELDAQVIKDSNGIVTEVKLPGKTLVFNVEPMVSVDGAAAVKLENNQLNGGAVKVRLPIPKDVADKYAKVVHEGDTDRYVTICTAENGDKYIEFTTTHFSAFTVSFTNELPVVEPEQPAQPSQPAASIESSTSNAAQSTPAPALKQDDSAYYTCKACGYHDWTAVDGGYKCDHCGYMESVKQIAGYPNVKGKAEVGKTAAAKAQVAAKTMSAIPQTSDDMPVTALAAIALAALFGLGVTVVMKRKHE